MSNDKPYVEFHNGAHMPIIGLGTWMGKADEMKQAVRIALEGGCRHIDTAFAYHNETAIGEVLKEIFEEGKIKREDLFIVTKLPPNGMRSSEVKHFLELSLKNLQLDYVNLYLVHMCFGFQNVGDTDIFPKDRDGNYLLDYTTDLVAIWKAMEEMVGLGWAKNIGVSNWSIAQIQRILDNCKIKPANNQVECHVYLQQNQLVDFCKANGITVCAYGPIGSPGKPVFVENIKEGVTVETPHLLSDPVIADIAKKHNKQSSHVLLKFLLQRGIVVIPKSTNPDRLKSNLKLFDFNLDASDMDTITKLNKDHRFFKFNHIKG